MNFGGTIRLNRVGVCAICGLIILIVFYLSPKGETNAFLSVNKNVNLRHLLIASIEAAQRGGREVKRTRSEPNLNEKSKGKTKEGAESLVTNADYRSHCVMYYGIANLFPNIKVVSEEKNQEKECKVPTSLELNDGGILGDQELPDIFVDASKVTVWIDPLDATQEYTENILECVTTMVCVAVQGDPVIGVIHKPFSQEPKTTWAWISRGRSPHLKPKSLENETKAVIVSRSHGGDVKKMLKEAFGESTTVIHSGGAGFKVLEVIGGNASAYVHTTVIKKWDICAGDAIMTEVGGRMTTLKNEDINYSGLDEINNDGILATLKDHDAYLKSIKRAMAT